jgi:hypothetical protein
VDDKQVQDLETKIYGSAMAQLDEIQDAIRQHDALNTLRCCEARASLRAPAQSLGIVNPA